MELLRFATAGSVDDGKSTLIGRLLHDAKALHDDQLEALASTSRRRGYDGLDLALITDGLRAERDQGITIDVAYRYFSTPRRAFIVADTPGHARYTRNMVTGASTSDLAVILVDARAGVVEQSRRHAHVASLLGIRHLVLAVNKMDLVDWSENAFDDVVEEFLRFTSTLDAGVVTPIPMSALQGDNVVDRSNRMDWYGGPPLLAHLEQVDVRRGAAGRGGVLPVQWVVRPRPGEGRRRGYAGMLAGGPLRPGDEVVVLPAGERTTLLSVESFDGPLEEAVPPLSVTVTLADELDVGRGDLVAAVDAAPTVTRELEASLCWFAEAPLRPGARVLCKHTTRVTRATVREVRARTDVTTLEEAPADSLGLNDIGTVVLATAEPLAVDLYTENRTTGSFLLIDESTNATIAAGMVSGLRASVEPA